MYQIASHARRDIGFAADQREAFDMALLRMVAFAPQPNSGEIATLTSPAQQSNANGDATKPTANNSVAKSAEASSTPAGNATQTASANTANAAPKTATQKKNNLNPSGDKTEPGKGLSPGAQAALAALNADPMPEADIQELLAATKATAQPDSKATAKTQTANTAYAEEPAQTADTSQPTDTTQALKKTEPTPVEEAAAITTIDIASLSVDTWPAAVANMSLSGMPRQLASHSVLANVTGSNITLHLEDHAEHLNTTQFNARLQTALSEYTRSDIALSITVVSETLDTPAKLEKQRNEASLKAARAAIDEDPLVKQLLSEVDGVVDHDSVQPIN